MPPPRVPWRARFECHNHPGPRTRRGPRRAGTFFRILARYVRERGSLTLMDALRKMSLMPAERLAKSTPAAHRKGRLQEGADADIVAFNPQSVADRSTYQAPREPSAGMQYVMVNGSVLIDAGQFGRGIFPGRPIAPDTARPSGVHHP